MQKKGFTLIELLVVIAIIGVLAAIGLTAFSGAQGKARDSKRKADLSAINSNLALWYDANTGYPLSGAGSVVDATTIDTSGHWFDATANDTPTACELNVSSSFQCVEMFNVSVGWTTPATGFAGKYAIPKTPGTKQTLGSYYYMTDGNGGKNATTDTGYVAPTMFGLFTKLESVADSYFISNSKGFSDVVTIASADEPTVLPTSALAATECANTSTVVAPGGAARNPRFSVCATQPAVGGK